MPGMDGMDGGMCRSESGYASEMKLWKLARGWFCERKEELRREFGVFWGNLERVTCFLEVVEIGYHNEIGIFFCDFYENLRNLFNP
jgi:hypothetical protein